MLASFRAPCQTSLLCALLPPSAGLPGPVSTFLATMWPPSEPLAQRRCPAPTFHAPSAGLPGPVVYIVGQGPPSMLVSHITCIVLNMHVQYLSFYVPCHWPVPLLSNFQRRLIYVFWYPCCFYSISFVLKLIICPHCNHSRFDSF